MPVMSAAPLKVTRKQRVELERMAVSSSLPHRVVVQASGLLLAARGVANGAIARECATTPDTVRRWRAKFESGGGDEVGAVPAAGGRTPSISPKVADPVGHYTMHPGPRDAAD